jgi:microcystin-dependent protein
MSDPFVAEIRIVPFNFAPRGWAFCNGQILPISQNTALFSLLGTNYGGDGRTSFALPDLQGRAPMFYGQGPGLSLHDLGESAGSETVTLIQTEMPAHQHQAFQSGVDADTPTPNNASWAGSEFGDSLRTPATGTFGATALAIAGNGLPHNNMQPYLTLNFIIAMQGVFPPRG